MLCLDSLVAIECYSSVGVCVGEHESHTHMNGTSEHAVNGTSSEHDTEVRANDGVAEPTSDDVSELVPKDQEVILIQDTGFIIKIAAPGLEPFDLQVSCLCTYVIN